MDEHDRPLVGHRRVVGQRRELRRHLGPDRHVDPGRADPVGEPTRPSRRVRPGAVGDAVAEHEDVHRVRGTDRRHKTAPDSAVGDGRPPFSRRAAVVDLEPVDRRPQPADPAGRRLGVRGDLLDAAALRASSETWVGAAVTPDVIRREKYHAYLTEDVPVEVVSDRINVSRNVLDQHYDCRFEEVKLEQRRGYLEDV